MADSVVGSMLQCEILAKTGDFNGAYETARQAKLLLNRRAKEMALSAPKFASLENSNLKGIAAV